MTGPDPAEFRWRTSSHSGNHGGACVQVGIRTAAARTPAEVAVRDTKNPAGGLLLFAWPTWSRFISMITMPVTTGG